MRLSRKQRREKYADEMCREVRFQIVKGICNDEILYEILTKWMRNATKTKYIRPIQPKKHEQRTT